MTSDKLPAFAARYAKALCSQNPESVAALFAENALFRVNGGPPTPALEVARGFMRDFPNMTVTFDKLEPRGDRTAFHWTLTGTYAGTGNHVRISGYELWKIDNMDSSESRKATLTARNTNASNSHRRLGVSVGLVTPRVAI